MWQHLAQIMDSLSHDASIRAVIISGRGEKAFTAGLDVCLILTTSTTKALAKIQELRLGHATGQCSIVRRQRTRA